MNRTLNRVQVDQDLAGSSRTRWVVTIEDDPTEEDSPQAQVRQHYFLQALADQPALLMCGPVRFERLTIWHNGKSWVAQAQAYSADQVSL